ncbi:MAG: hypothetical protein ACRDBL_07340 [Rhabdaerophilum sp.]
MTQAILLASLAGFASALLTGMLTPGMMSLAFLFLVSPLPLFIAGFAWHPLVAALAGLFGAILIDFATGDRAAVAFASIMALPAYAMSAVAWRSFATETRMIAKDGIATGQIALSAVIYIALVIVISAIWVEPDYAVFTQKLRGFVLEGIRQMGAPGNPAVNDPATLNRLADLMTAIMLPMSGFVIITTITLSAALGAMVAERSGRMEFVKPSFNEFRLPGGSLILFGATLLIGMWEGYIAVFAEIAALGIALLLMLQGLGVLHTRLRGKPSRGFLLSVAWASVIVFGLPALLFVGVGVADHLFDLRNRKDAGR